VDKYPPVVACELEIPLVKRCQVLDYRLIQTGQFSKVSSVLQLKR
jgi:hypothetical protein